MRRNVLIALMAFLAFGFSATAQKTVVETSNEAGWHKIAETKVDLQKDRDEITVLGKDHFKAVKLKVTDAPMEIIDMTVFYENETQQDVSVKHTFKGGDESRVIDLIGSDRAIKKIVLVYRTVPNAGKDKAHVEIWGRK